MRQRVGEICCQIYQILNYITPLKTAKMPPITPVNAWPSWTDARREYILCYYVDYTECSSELWDSTDVVDIKNQPSCSYNFSLYLVRYFCAISLPVGDRE